MILHLLTTKGVAVLKALIECNFHPVIHALEIGRDSNNQDDGAEQMFRLAHEHGIPAYERGQLPETEPDLLHLAVGWRWLIRDVPDKQLIVFHDSPLPAYRGFAPLVNMLIMGEPELGVTALFGAVDYDRGDIIAQGKVPVSYPCTIAQAIEMVSPLYAQLAVEVVQHHLDKTLTGQPQREEEASYSLWRDEKDYWLNFSESADTLERTINACGFPYAGAQCWVNDIHAIVMEATALPDLVVMPRMVGKVIRMDGDYPIIVCGHGLLRIQKIANFIDKSNMLPLKKFRTRFS